MTAILIALFDASERPCPGCASLEPLAVGAMAQKLTPEACNRVRTNVQVQNIINGSLYGEHARTALERQLREMQDATPALRGKAVTPRQLLEAYLIHVQATYEQAARLRHALSAGEATRGTTP